MSPRPDWTIKLSVSKKKKKASPEPTEPLSPLRGTSYFHSQGPPTGHHLTRQLAPTRPPGPEMLGRRNELQNRSGNPTGPARSSQASLGNADGTYLSILTVQG